MNKDHRTVITVILLCMFGGLFLAGLNARLQHHEWPFSSNVPQDGGGWRPISTAPRDGTIIETRDDYGVMPSYALDRWQTTMSMQMCTMNGSNLSCRTVEMPVWKGGAFINIAPKEAQGSYITPQLKHFVWRPFHGDPKHYVDPTNGADWKSGYEADGSKWRRRCAETEVAPDCYYSAGQEVVQ